MTDGQERKNERKNRRRNADRRKALLPWQRPRSAPLAERRTSIGVPRGSRPKEPFIARDTASGQASWDVAGTRFAHRFERHYPPGLSQSSNSTSRSGRRAGELMPKAARVRIASSPAGTALARAIRDGLPDHVRPTRARSESLMSPPDQRLCQWIGDDLICT